MTAQHIYRMDEIQPGLQDQVGNKAFYLGLLAQAGYPIVPGIVVSSSMFRSFWRQIQWSAPLFSDFPHSSLHIDVENHQQLRAIAQQLQQAVCTTSLPNEWLQAIEAAIRPLEGAVLIFRPSLALHGAPNPTLDAQIQGLLPTQTCKPELEAIATALKKTWAGLFRAKSLFCWQRLGVSLQQILLSVLVQPMYSTQASGRLRSTTRYQVEVEAIWGTGKAITTGEAIPDRYWIDAVSGALHHHQPGQQFSVYGVTKPPRKSVSPSSPQFGDEVDQPDHHDPLSALNLDWQPSEWEGLYVASLDPALSEKSILSEGSQVSDALTPLEESSESTCAQPISEKVLAQLAHLGQDVNLHLSLNAELEWIVCQPTYPSPYRAARQTLQTSPEKLLDIYLTQVLPSGLNHVHSDVENLSRATAVGVDLPIAEASDMRGMGAAPGQITARAWVFGTELAAHGSEAIAPPPPGYVLIAPNVMPGWLDLIRQSGGIVSEQGGMTCHAAVIARELGIPAVVGVPSITQKIDTGDLIVLDGDRGTIRRLSHASPTSEHEGKAEISLNATKTQPTIGWATQANSQANSQADIIPLDNHLDSQPKPKWEFAEPDATQILSDSKPSSHSAIPNGWQRIVSHLTESDRPNATQLMASISQTEALPRLANLPCDGIGLLRAEMAILPLFDKKTPQQWIDQGDADMLCQRIADHIILFAEAVYPRPMTYRTLDVRSRDFGHLFHAESDSNAYDLLGIHGTWSYQLEPEMFQIELAALRKIQLMGMDNIRLLLPFVRTVEEFNFCRRQVVEAELYDSPTFQLWIMAEVPSVLFLLADYVEAGVDGIAIGTNDLTQLVLGIDRDHPHMQPIFNQRHPAIQRALRHLIETAQELGIPCSICGQAPVQHPELIASLVQWGVTTICVSPAAMPQTYRAIARAERAMLLDALRQGDRPLDAG